MLEKIKGIGTQVATKAGDAVDGVTATVKGGVESLAHTASNVTEALNEKAVRASTAQMCSILEIALDELKNRPLSEQPVSLKATVNIGIAALEMEIKVPSAAQSEEGANKPEAKSA